ncbi:MAG TPA: hypothetical protein VHG89_06935 [Verrucomicrobiae bacterium]|nr:hypothetical protein [Verrucomicrobiae bacterium]
MFFRLGKVFVVVALVATLGAHWALLQTVAWTAMLANNLCTQSVSAAVSQTFDGEHPCPLCKAIAAGKKSEQKSEIALQVQKLEFPPAKENFILIAPSHFLQFSPINYFAELLPQKPPTPPPRAA